MDGLYQNMPPGVEEGMPQMQPTQPGFDGGIGQMQPPQDNQPPVQLPQPAPMPSGATPYGQPQYRVKQGVPVGTRVVSKHDPNLEYQPHDGPLGLGIYKNSDEEPGVIEFRPIVPDQGDGPHFSTPQLQDERGPMPKPLPFNPRRLQPPPPQSNLIDPVWIEHWNQVANEDYSGFAPHYKTLILEDKILPMLEYISRIKGPQAEMYKKDLERRAADLGYGKDKGEVHDEKWFASRRGMVGTDYDKAVSWKGGVSGWRK